mgnify:CR=1 FL=1
MRQVGKALLPKDPITQTRVQTRHRTDRGSVRWSSIARNLGLSTRRTRNDLENYPLIPPNRIRDPIHLGTNRFWDHDALQEIARSIQRSKWDNRSPHRSNQHLRTHLHCLVRLYCFTHERTLATQNPAPNLPRHPALSSNNHHTRRMTCASY